MLKNFAQVISVIFHPLLMLQYMLVMLLLVNPYLFRINDIRNPESVKLLLAVFFTSFLLPALAIFLMQRLEIIKTLEMRDRQERIGPFIASGIFYLWLCVTAHRSSEIPTAFTICVWGTTIGLFTAFIINLFFKISLHALGVGGFVGAVIVTMKWFSYGVFPIWLPFYGAASMSINLVLMLALLIAGLVATARLILEAHEPKELIAGFALGIVAQGVASLILI
jgi:hypothetical protein